MQNFEYKYIFSHHKQRNIIFVVVVVFFNFISLIKIPLAIHLVYQRAQALLFLFQQKLTEI
jgi:hypothetical protein